MSCVGDDLDGGWLYRDGVGLHVNVSFACISLMLIEMLIGLKELAVAMADPFGNDEVDGPL